MLSMLCRAIIISCALWLSACAGKSVVSPSPQATIGPYPQPHGRILLLGSHRAQLLFRCQRSAYGEGSCRFTHGASGRIVELHWKEKELWLRDNQTTPPQWQPTNMVQLAQLGMVVHPATILQLLNGTIPAWLRPKGNNRWQGEHNHARIGLRWHPQQQRLDLTNLSKGAQVRLLMAP